MIDIQKLSQLVGLRVVPEMEQRLFVGCTNILGFLDQLQEVDTSMVQLSSVSEMHLGNIGADGQQMDKDLFLGNICHSIEKGQMMVKHIGRE